tara:strand:+ start:4220 stop:4939 length:720 start_codon:yes stop_codon:yes gene_type:complete
LSQKKKIAGLLQRYPFVDFADVIATERAQRKNALRTYVDRERKGRWKSYNGLRSLVPDIAGVQRGLDPSARADFSTIEKGLVSRCHRDDLAFNTEAAKCLFDFLRPASMDAYDDHPRASLRIAPDRTIVMGVEHYVVDGERAAFRYVHPRKERLEGHLPDILMSLIHHNYVRDDYADFEVEIIDLSCEPVIGPRGGIKSGDIRAPRILRLDPSDLILREDLNEQADHVYSLLMELSEEI